VIFESYPTLGYNYRMTDIQAAGGREQLRRLPDIIGERRALAARYRELLGGIAGLELPVEPEWAHTNWQSHCVRLPAPCDQRLVMQAMLDAGISTRRGIMCSHREEACRTRGDRAQAAVLGTARRQTFVPRNPVAPGLPSADNELLCPRPEDSGSCDSFALMGTLIPW
jgi:dTDP-4-amino-4,6-dideoxygalactose transaminase